MACNGCPDTDRWRYRQAESPGADISRLITRNAVGLRHTASELDGLQEGLDSSFFRRVVTKKSRFGSVKFPLPSPTVALAKRANQNAANQAAPPVLGLSDNQIRAPSDFFPFFQTSSILLTCIWDIGFVSRCTSKSDLASWNVSHGDDCSPCVDDIDYNARERTAQWPSKRRLDTPDFRA